MCFAAYVRLTIAALCVVSAHPLSTVTTLAGTPGISGIADGVGSLASFAANKAVAIDATGSIALVVDYSSYTVRRIDVFSREVSTIAGSGARGNADGIGTAASFTYPTGVALNGAGSMAVIVSLCSAEYHVATAISVTGRLLTLP